MASRVKEDEKNERIIRSLLKLPENRRCINCNSLGPQYVCTNFWTFVCTNCSGIHREFTHRVKSVSMAKFTSQEVNALQEGGNQRAKGIYHKELDPQRNSFPDSSNVERLRDFIKHVYVDRRYTGERNLDKPPRAKMGEKEDSYENRRLDSYQGGSRSPPYDDTYERRYSERSSPAGRSYDGQRSPGYDLEARQYNDYKKSPGRPEIVNDWRREDRFGNGRRNDDRRISDGDSKLDAESPERPRDLDSSSPPIVRPVRDILGDNTIPPKANSARAADSSVQTQRTASSSSLGSTNGNPVEVKLETSGSLIDFDADPEPAPAAAVPQPQQTTVAQSYPQPANSTNDNNWASFDVSSEVKAPQAPANVNSLESLLSQLSVSAPGPSYVSGATGNMGAPTIAPSSSVSTFSPVGAPVPAPGLAQVFPVNGGSFLVKDPTSGQWPTMQHQQPSLYSANGIQPAAQEYIPSVDEASSNQPWNLTHTPHAQGQPSISAPQAQQDASRSGRDVSTIASQPSGGDAKPSGRRELPAFPSAASFQAALPNFQPLSRPGLVRTSRLNTPSSAWMPLQSSSYSSTVPPQAPQYASLVPPQLSSYSSAVPSQAPQYASLVPPQLSSYSSAVPSQAPQYASLVPSQAPQHASRMPPSKMMLSSCSSAVPSQAPQHASRMPPSKMMLSSYSSAVPSQAPQFASRMPPRAYVVQQVPSSMPPSGQP
ncbi:PREDICTED: probable ADP-ribosylation factor GTPase-activating protein AGD14 [Prunus mume]|uniref:Probable ADP-ribosylation factor GTPase-activating protein AGD14 n=1 Tax=Prunus mume TaxID=102107 RepID=A0ABM1LWR9_PRUMU|nr:PREDICTED: probable ADP-ribosylation factor GTPase-activating protein AGD14 [Prunus mume]